MVSCQTVQDASRDPSRAYSTNGFKAFAVSANCFWHPANLAAILGGISDLFPKPDCSETCHIWTFQNLLRRVWKYCRMCSGIIRTFLELFDHRAKEILKPHALDIPLDTFWNLIPGKKIWRKNWVHFLLHFFINLLAFPALFPPGCTSGLGARSFSRPAGRSRLKPGAELATSKTSKLCRFLKITKLQRNGDECESDGNATDSLSLQAALPSLQDFPRGSYGHALFLHETEV